VSRRTAALFPLLLLSCTLPPLRGRVEIGSDPYAVVVADGPGGADLYAIHGQTGEMIALTFTPVRESAPSLAPDGGAVVFLRDPAARDRATAGRTAWVMNLLSGSERELTLPRDAAATPERVGWARDGSAAYVETSRGTWRFAMPPAGDPELVMPAGRAAADSSFMVLLGTPAFARAEPCGSPAAVCVFAGGDTGQVLAVDAADPARWGSDSVAFVREGRIHVWPLGGGAPRAVEVEPARPVTGAISYFPGRA
jgi:hypothetical protein